MKRSKKQQLFNKAAILITLFAVFVFSSCKEEEIFEDPIASFQYEIDDEDFLKVTFQNFSQKAETYVWDFGDGQTSTAMNPIHTYSQIGEYTVELTAVNKVGVSHSFSELIAITDPFEELRKLAGDVSKTWKLYRVGTSMGVGPSEESPREWWSLENDGWRPCVYRHEFTFTFNGQYIFDDKGHFWGEGITDPAACIEATAANMVNFDGADVSAWLGGTHQFTYVPATRMVTLTGMGAWIGLPKTATSGEVTVPQPSVTFKIVSIEQFDGYDLMNLRFVYDGVVWDFTYASYSNPALEPELITEPPWVPIDLPDITPNELSHSFQSASSFVLLGDITGESVITVGEDDPAGGTTKVGKFVRTTAQYQEAQLEVSPDKKDIQFDNLTTASIDVYLPSSNNYGSLTKKVVIGFADKSETFEWWTRLILYESAELALDQWVTVTFTLTNAPSWAAVEGNTVYNRDDLDMVFIQVGGSGHDTPATFYIRNLIIQ